MAWGGCGLLLGEMLVAVKLPKPQNPILVSQCESLSSASSYVPGFPSNCHIPYCIQTKSNYL